MGLSPEHLKTAREIIEMKSRDYAHEYASYHSKPKQIARRAGRNQARRKMVAAGRAKKFDGKDTDHVDRNPLNNAPSNLRVMSKGENRSRNSELSMKITSNRLFLLNRVLDRSLIQFSLTAGLAVGAAAHVGSNAVFKRMLTPGTLSQRIGSSIFQAGVRHAKDARPVHPFIRGAVDALAGPELGHLYESGLKSSREARKAMAVGKEAFNGDLGKGAAGIVTGRRSGFMDKLMSFLPRSRGDSKVARISGSIAAGAGAALADPVLPAVNLARSYAASTNLGDRMMKGEFIKGARKGPQEGITRHIRDLVVSPSLNIARDAGATATGAMTAADRIKNVRARVVSSRPLPA